MCDHLLSQVWSESSDGSGAVNFLTGMGGFLQAVLFGFTGFRSVMEPPVAHNEKINCRTKKQQRRAFVFFFSCVLARVQKECLAFTPLLPSDISELCIRGVNYLGRQMDWLLRKDEVCVILRDQPGSATTDKSGDLQVVLKASGSRIPLVPGNAHKEHSNQHLFHFNQRYMKYIILRFS